jgi:G:T/U-mismatch repair DNA glycosylase
LLGARGTELAFERLPSTSPAFASLGFEQKLARWAAVLAPHLDSAL